MNSSSTLTTRSFILLTLISLPGFLKPVLAQALRTPTEASKYAPDQYLWATSAANAIRNNGQHYRVHTTALALDQYRQLKSQGKWNHEQKEALKKSLIDMNEDQSKILSVAASRKNYDARGFLASSLMQGMSLEERTRFRDGFSAATYGKAVEAPLKAVSILKVNPKIALGLEGVKVGLSLSDDADRLTLGKKEQVESIGYHLALEDRYGKKAVSIFAESFAAAKEDSEFMDVLRSVNFQAVPLSPTATLEEMKAANPKAAELAGLLAQSRSAEKGPSDQDAREALLSERKEHRSSIERLRKELMDELKSQSKTPKEIEEQLARLEASVQEWQSQQRDEVKKKKLQEDMVREVEQLALAYQKQMRRLSDLDASFQILGTIGGLIKDPEIARVMQKGSAVGSIGVEIYSSILSFKSSKFNPDAISSMVLTGNLVSGVGALVQLFSGEPSADEMILEQLGQTRAQIEQLRQEMHERLSQIDKKLDQALIRLDQILQVAESNHQAAMGQMADLKRSMGLQYSELRVYLATHFTHLHEEQLRESVNSCFESQDFFVDGPSAESLEECLRVFVRYATRKVFEAFNDVPVPAVFSDATLMSAQLQLPESKGLNLLRGYIRHRLARSDFDSVEPLPDVRVFETSTAASILILQDHSDILKPKIRENVLVALKEKVDLFENFRRKVGDPKVLWNSAIDYRRAQQRFIQNLLKLSGQFRRDHQLYANDPATGLIINLPIFEDPTTVLATQLENADFVVPIRSLDQGGVLIACPGSRSIGDERWLLPTMEKVQEGFQHAPNWLKAGLHFGIVKLRLCADVPTVAQASARPSPHHGTGEVSLRLMVRFENGADVNEETIAERRFGIMGWGGHDIVSMRVRWQEQPGFMWRNAPFSNFQAGEFRTPNQGMKDSVISQIKKEIGLRRLKLISEWIKAMAEDTLPDEAQSSFSWMNSLAEIHLRLLKFSYPEATEHDDKLQQLAFSSRRIIKTKQDMIQSGLNWLQKYWPDIQNPNFELLNSPGSTNFFMSTTREDVNAWDEYEKRLNELNPSLELSTFQVQSERIEMLRTLLFP